MSGDRWKNLEVWRVADDFAVTVYKETKGFPREETYALVTQLRRAALSDTTNIDEWYSRNGDRELARFLDIALASLAETKYLIHFAYRLGFWTQGEFDSLTELAEGLGAKLWKFTETVKHSRDCNQK